LGLSPPMLSKRAVTYRSSGSSGSAGWPTAAPETPAPQHRSARTGRPRHHFWIAA
jgi:hypothetical protein